MDKIKLDSQKIRRYPIYERGQGARLTQKGEVMSHFAEGREEGKAIMNGTTAGNISQALHIARACGIAEATA